MYSHIKLGQAEALRCVRNVCCQYGTPIHSHVFIHALSGIIALAMNTNKFTHILEEAIIAS